MKPSTTTPSTIEDDATVAACLPPDVAARTFDRLNELDRIKARQCRQAATMRQAKVGPKQALVQRFIDQHHAALLARQPRDRCSFLVLKMQQAQLRGETFTIPSDKYLRHCLDKVFGRS